jgi:hypothetical protein
MELKKLLAGWNKVCPGCNIARKYPDSFVGKKVRNHWEKGCAAHDAYVELYGANEPSSKKAKAKAGSSAKNKPAAKANAGKPGKNAPAAGKAQAARGKKKR